MEFYTILIFILLQLILSFIFRIGYYQRFSPFDLMLSSISRVIGQAWKKSQQELSDSNSEIDIDFLNTALIYLNRREDVEYKKEIQNHNRNVANEKINEIDKDSFDWGVVFVILLGSAIILIVIRALYRFLLQEPIYLIYIVLTLFIFFLLIKLFNKLSKFLVPVFAGQRNFDSWESIKPRSASDHKNLRMSIYRMMGESKNIDFNNSDEKADPDLMANPEQSLPVPPGITEYVVSNNELSLEEAELDLKRNRKFHYQISIVSTVLFFFLIIFICIYSIVFVARDIEKIILIGILLSIIVGLFSRNSTRRSREAQIALALFGSYLGELKSRLKEAESSSESKIKQKLTLEAYRNFRIGLNELWQKEQSDYEKWIKKSLRTRNKQQSNFWVLQSIIIGLIAGTLVYLLPKIHIQFQIPVIVTILVSVYLLMRNPKARYFRAFWTVLTTFVTTTSIPNIILLIKSYGYLPDVVLITEQTKSASSINLIITILMIVLLLLDYNERKAKLK